VSSPPSSAGPMPGDLKRAEEFKREKSVVVGDVKVTSLDESMARGEDGKRESVMFDAEGRDEVKS
jgi:hypothetical protein